MQPAALASRTPTRAARRWRLLPLAPTLTLALLAGPVCAGLAGAFLPAFGWFPPLGGVAFGLGAWRSLLDWPGLWGAIRLTITTALGSTVLSLTAAMLILSAAHGRTWGAAMQRALAPLLAVPHAAAAFGLAFLIAPSGWIVRLFSPWATGFDVAPDWLIVGDPWGLSMVAGLVLKEVPFLLLMGLAGLSQIDAARGVLLARTLGHGPVGAWWRVVLPQLYPQLRLPVLAVLAYSASVVDVAMILGPGVPPPLAVQITRWSVDPDLTSRFTAAAGSVLLLGLTLGLIGLWLGAERLAGRIGGRWLRAGRRIVAEPLVRRAGTGLAIVGTVVMLAGLASLAVWSVAGLWVFPEAWPRSLTLTPWQRADATLWRAAGETMLIGAAATLLALLLVLGCLEAEHRHGLPRPRRALWLLYLPLLVPQVAFLTGLQSLALVLGLDGARGPVIAAHLVFVTPYVFLVLAEPWRAWDARAALVAATLGATPDAVFWRVRLPMLLRPVLAAAAVGFAVSVAQYLPTLLIGGGRVTTLTTEALALASGGDRRLVGATALAQSALPLVAFALALAIPAVVHRHRLGLRP